MNEMDLLREFRAGRPATDLAAISPARRQLLRAAHGRPSRTLGLPRLRWQLAVPGVLALVVAAGLLVANLPASSPRAVPEAVNVLRLAAQTAGNSPDLAPRPDQFVFVESIDASIDPQRAPDGVHTVYRPDLSDRRIWQSVDGTHDGLLLTRTRPGSTWVRSPLPGCRNGRMDGIKGDQVFPHAESCTVDTSSVLDNLPTSTDGMFRYLYSDKNGSRTADQRAWTKVGDLIRESYARPAVMAAIFSAAARIPGVSVVHGVTDVAGRPGIAVALTDLGVREELIFDPATHAYLGDRGVNAEDQDSGKKGTVVGSSAILRLAIADKSGVLP
ncbi:MAG: hypothetical protein JWO79_286 [Actinomycetia bacterium]|nr:hypothetical protein [Actinomycetes bacterium]